MIRELGKNPKDADDRLAMALECQSAGDYSGAFVEASEAARLKNTSSVRAVLKKALIALDAREIRDSREAKLRSDAAESAGEGKADSRDDKLRSDEKFSRPEAPVLGQLKPMVNIAVDETSNLGREKTAEAANRGAARGSQRLSQEPPVVLAQATPTPEKSEAQSSDTEPQSVIDQARELAQTGHRAEAIDMLEKLISHIKGRAAIDESSGFELLDQALDTLIEMYLKQGKYEEAEINLNELVMLRESARDHTDPVLGSTYRQYAKVLTALHRSHEAKIYEDKADAITTSKEVKQ
jgi:tetratricopeptide (TPR) repeat protein